MVTDFSRFKVERTSSLGTLRHKFLSAAQELANEYYACQEDDDVGPEKVTKAALTKRMNIEGDASNRVQVTLLALKTVAEAEAKSPCSF